MFGQPVLAAERDSAAANDAALLLWTRVRAEDFGLPLLGHLLSWQPMDEPAAEPSEATSHENGPWNF